MSKVKLGFTALFTLILLSMFAAFASAEEFTPTPGNPAPEIHVGTIDNNGEVNQHRTHGNFQNNTNSCANCHSTHNGDNAKLVKFEKTESDLCLTCHDGTLGFYNVKGQGAGAGTFNTTHESSSMHNVGTVSIGSAPGALDNKSADTMQCSSCHNPHGSTNDRLLKTTVAGVTYSATPIKLALTEDPDFAAINSNATNSGLKITKSIGPKENADKVNYANFCSTCHDTYDTGSGTKTALGHYSHTTNSSSQGRNCASCHYAHGTDINILKDAAGKTIADYQAEGWEKQTAIAYMKDVSAGGSNNKKYTNMSVCWTCHTSSHPLDTPMPAQKGDPKLGTGEYWNWVYSSRYLKDIPTFNEKANIR
ncbi:cytochrome c3 family protein [Bacillus sp. OK048]|uniref:cytochrome c3 family protein n=1 Tax=Bacillus sp. OK048 TaxID=1882761 RepID=UPI00088450DD|nr:cytochrome c3 family protein [Bacillus sp. OK048]SDM70891.1 doubled CXXCH domain-containing protein [Bacillus sp. OK048]